MPLRITEADLQLDFPALRKQLPLHVVWPTSGGPFPVVLFICRTDVPGPPDDGALRAIRHASTLFLDAYAQGDRAALGLLRDDGPGAAASDRAALSVR